MRKETGPIMKTGLRIGALLWLCAFFGLAAAQTGTGNTVPEAQEVLAFPYDSAWKLANRGAFPNRESLMEFVRQDDDIRDWKELLTIQNFRYRADARTPEDHLNALKALREQRCPGATTWAVIAKDDASIVYEWQAGASCLGMPDQHEIARILLGQYNVFIIHYVKKTTQLDETDRAEWIQKLSAAKIVRQM
jgi:hypothetical protein